LSEKEQTSEEIAKILEEEQALEDINEYFDFDEQILMSSKNINLVSAKEYVISKGSKPLRNKEPTQIFLKWLKIQHPEEIEKVKIKKEEPEVKKVENPKTPYQKMVEKKEIELPEDLGDINVDFLLTKSKPKIIMPKIEEETIEPEESLLTLLEKEFVPVIAVETAPNPVIAVETAPNPVIAAETAPKSNNFFNDLFGEKPIINKDDIKADKMNKVYTKSAVKPILFNLEEYPIIILLWGYDGTSKSEQILKFRDKEGRAPLIFDFENKLRTVAIKLGFPQENIVTSGKYNKKYQFDGPTTLREFRILLDDIKERFQKGENLGFSAIALDGITDLRPHAVKEWLAEHPTRENPVTPGDNAEVNSKVRDIVFSLINLGRSEDIHIFLTAQVSGHYENGQKIYDIPNCKDWIWHNVDHKFRLWKVDDKRKFYAFCEKSYYDPFWTIDLTDWTHNTKISLMNILQDPKKITMCIEEYKKQQKEETDNPALF
jgi:hypothetical protein